MVDKKPPPKTRTCPFCKYPGILLDENGCMQSHIDREGNLCEGSGK